MSSSHREDDELAELGGREAGWGGSRSPRLTFGCDEDISARSSQAFKASPNGFRGNDSVDLDLLLPSSLIFKLPQSILSLKIKKLIIRPTISDEI